MTANSFDEGIMIGALLAESSGSTKANIKALTITTNGTYNAEDDNVDGYSPIYANVSATVESLTVTANGTYNAPDGVDGYDPVIVDVPGYDEGYEDAKDKYEEIIKQLLGDGEDVEDDDGNVIENAVVTDDDEELKDMLDGVIFGSDGGEVTVQGLSGADTTFKIECEKTTNEYISGGYYVTTGFDLTVINKNTGRTYTQGGSMNWNADPPNEHTFKIEDVSFSYDNSKVSVTVQFYYNGTPITRYGGKQTLDCLASVVGGTSFGATDTQWAMTQQQN